MATAGALLAACGAEERAGEPAATKGVGEEIVGSVAYLAQCRDWVRGTEAEQRATIEDIRAQINREDGVVRTQPLTDEQAFDVFDSACAEPFAKSFRLYKLYASADAFVPLVDPAEE